MSTWDVFHSDRLEVERGLSTDQVREALAGGGLRDDDLIRPSGTAVPWARLVDTPELFAAEPAPAPPPKEEPEPEAEDLSGVGPPDAEPPTFFAVLDDEDEDQDDDEATPGPAFAPEVGEVAAVASGEGAGEPFGEFDLDLRETRRNLGGNGDDPTSSLELVTWDDDLDEDEYDPQDEDEAAAEFTLSRGGPETVEELDLAAMVDVAFQLVLFFLVTATTVLYKSLEVPKPNPENAPPAAAAARGGRTPSTT